MTPSQDHVRLSVCGRVCLFGEHSDWAADFGLHAGFCLVVGTDQSIGGRAKRAEFFRVSTQPEPDSSLQARQAQCPWTEKDLQAAAQDAGEFFRHCAGTAHEMMALPGVTGGLDLHIDQTDLPLGKGVASSAAVCILVAQAFDAAYDLRLFPHELMQLASPLLHQVLNWSDLAGHIYGGKGVGSQGDGTAQFVARGAAHRDEAMRKIEAAFPGMRCYRLSIPPC